MGKPLVGLILIGLAPLWMCGATGVAETIPAEQIAVYLDHLADVRVFDVYAGQNSALKDAASESDMALVAAGFPVEMASRDLFRQGFSDGDFTVYVAGISSVDAQALRLQVDLSALGPGDELWEIDPSGARAFGPYGFRDHLPGGRWLPTVFDDMAVLVLRTMGETLPDVRIEVASHFFWDLESAKAEMTCHLNVACEDESIQDLATGVGFMVLPTSNGDQAACSGCLIDSVVQRPYFLTANHCVPSGVQAWNVDIVWDYRSAECTPEVAPTLASLPRSSGMAVLATDSSLDGTLMLLDQVPGTRTYLPWDTRDPVVDEAVIGLHHPSGNAPISTCFMRISKGNVTNVDTSGSQLGLYYAHETRVLWSEGGTETGSSGSVLLFGDGAGGYRITGMLSGGTVHTCGPDRSNNYDYYASFRDFYPAIEGYLTGTPPDAPQNVQASDGDYRGSVRVTWDAVSGATSYMVYRSQADAVGDSIDLLATGVMETDHDDHDVGGDGTECVGEGSQEQYYYWVRARNDDGDSGFSEPDLGYSAVLSPPANVEASDAEYAGSVHVTWDAVPGATSYMVYRSLADMPDDSMELLAASVTDTTYEDYDVSGGGMACIGGGEQWQYYYWVRASDGNGDSCFSEPDLGYSGKASLPAALQTASVPGSLERHGPFGDMLVLMTPALLLIAIRRRPAVVK
jgi:hypothetical protein